MDQVKTEITELKDLVHMKLYSTSDENRQRNVGGEKAIEFEGKIDTKFRKGWKKSNNSIFWLFGKLDTGK